MHTLRSLVVLFLLTVSAIAQNGDAARADDEATVASSNKARHAVPQTIRFSGAVRTNGAGTVALTFALYAEPQGGTPLWVETQNVNVDDQGRFTVLLGAATAGGMPVRMFANAEARWLGIRLAQEGAAELARVALVSVPYALAAADAQSLNGRPASDFQLTRTAAQASGEAAAGLESSGAVNSTSNTLNRVAKFTATDTIGDSLLFDNGTNVGIGTTSPADKLHVAGAIRFGPGSFTAGVGKFYVDAQHGTLLTATTGTTNDLGIVATSGNLLLTNPTGTNNLVLLSGGGFGVNTSNITEKLTVNGGIAFGPSSFSAGAPTLYRDAAHGSVLTASAGSQNDLALVSRVGNLLLTNPTNTNHLVFFSGGNFGLNTFTPTSLLDVNGQVRAAGGIKFGDGTTQTTAATGGGGGGDITAVIAGTGLTGGATSGDATLAVNTTTIQSRVTGTCATGNYVRVINQDGTVTCGADAGGGGGGLTLPFSGTASTTAGAFTINQSNSSPVPVGDHTFSQVQAIPTGVVGNATATTQEAIGVAGYSVSPDGVAIVAWNNASTGEANAVLGITASTTGKAVNGLAIAGMGQTVGVEGESDSIDGKGVRGRANALSGSTIGVEGKVDSSTGTAGLFITPGGSGNFVLRGNNNSQDVFKVDGNGTVFASAYKDLVGNSVGTGTVTSITAGTGLTGGTISTSGTIALSTTFTDARYAQLAATNAFTGAQNSFTGSTANPIVSVTQNSTGTAVQGLNNSSGLGVFGQSTSSIGVQGTTNAGPTTFQAGVRGTSTGSGGIGVYGQSTSVTGTTIGVKGSVLAATGIAGVFDNQGGGQILSGQNNGTEKFAVNANGEITTKSVKGASLASDVLALPGVAFSGLEAKATANGALDNNQSATNKGFHSVLLPSGVVVTSLRICGRDFDNPGQIVAKLYRRQRDLTVFSASEQIASAASGTTFSQDLTQCFTTADLNAGAATINNSTYTYYVQLEMTNFVQVNSVEIVY